MLLFIYFYRVNSDIKIAFDINNMSARKSTSRAYGIFDGSREDSDFVSDNSMSTYLISENL